MPCYRILAPAKVNLTLEITSLLPGGYHELDTVFCWLELADVVEWTPAARASLELTQVLAGGLPVVADEDNLVMRALRLLEQKVGRELPVAIRLHKNIPAGGGLGGGSSDAAALLYGLNESHLLGIELRQLQEWGGQLGADVAFCVRGGCARGLGKGDRLTPLPAPAPLEIVLACPDFGCPTPAIYRQWDVDQPRQRPGASQELAGRLARGEAWDDLLSNDLQPAAEAYRGELVGVARALREAGCLSTLLSGSGSTVLGFPPPGGSDAVLAALPPGLTCRATRLCGRARPDFAGLESHEFISGSR